MAKKVIFVDVPATPYVKAWDGHTVGKAANQAEQMEFDEGKVELIVAKIVQLYPALRPMSGNPKSPPPTWPPKK